MRTVLQRVSNASVTIDGTEVAAIGHGLLILLGIEQADDSSDVAWLVGKIVRLRIFADSEDKMNLSLSDTGGDAIVVSQFTLHGATRKGNRPSFIRAARPDQSEPLYEQFCEALAKEIDRPVGRGRFGADMQVTLTNDGPVTLIIDSRKRE